MIARRKPDIDPGTYSNHVNVLVGVLKSLGLERRAKLARSLREVMDGTAAEVRP